MNPAKILVVDDESEICQITKNFLKKKNYLCFSAATKAEAIEFVKKEHPQLVLLDLCLKDASGIELLAEIKGLDKDIKVIIVTGLGDQKSIRQAEEYGVDGFITKPFTASFLNELVAKELSERTTGGG